MSATLPRDVAALVELSAAVAARDPEARRAAMARASVEADPREAEEALLQLYLFLGFPAALNALREWRTVSGRSPPREVDGADRGHERWEEQRGEAVCALVYGASYKRLRGNVRRLHPALDRWMVTEGYGKVLGRPALGLVRRELCIVGMLAVTGWEPQLHSHLRGALNAGAGPDEVGAALEIGLAHAPRNGWPQRARKLWRHVRERHARTPRIDGDVHS
ncbi:MAG: carboxymuconolactone decarboxylase family protein [Gemmatimonadota bacterium]